MLGTYVLRKGFKMKEIVLNATQHVLPLNSQIQMLKLLNLFDAHLIDERSKTLDDAVITVDTSKVNTKIAGFYPITFMTVYQEQEFKTDATLVISNSSSAQSKLSNLSNSESESNPSKQSNKPKDKKSELDSKKIRNWIIAALVLTLALIFGISSCQSHQQEQANDAAQTSKIDRLNKNQSKNKRQINSLRNQVGALKAAQKQYQQDRNQAELQRKVDEIKDTNANLKSNSDPQVQQAVDHLNQVADQIKSNPNQDLSNLNSRINNLMQNQQEQQNLLSKVSNQIKQWLQNIFA